MGHHSVFGRQWLWFAALLPSCHSVSLDLADDELCTAVSRIGHPEARADDLLALSQRFKHGISSKKRRLKHGLKQRKHKSRRTFAKNGRLGLSTEMESFANGSTIVRAVPQKQRFSAGATVFSLLHIASRRLLGADIRSPQNGRQMAELVRNVTSPIFDTLWPADGNQVNFTKETVEGITKELRPIMTKPFVRDALASAPKRHRYSKQNAVRALVELQPVFTKYGIPNDKLVAAIPKLRQVAEADPNLSESKEVLGKVADAAMAAFEL